MDLNIYVSINSFFLQGNLSFFFSVCALKLFQPLLLPSSKAISIFLSIHFSSTQLMYQNMHYSTQAEITEPWAGWFSVTDLVELCTDWKP